jgi:Mg2+/Co2+ transporter CorB
MDLYMVLPSLIFLGFLILCSAFFSASESAMTAASRARMHARAKNGDWRAGLVNKIMGDKDRLIGAILLGNNTVNTLAAAVSTAILIRIFGDVGIYYATAAITLILLIFGEVIPKTYALYHADQVARLVAPVLKLLMVITRPVTRCVSFIAIGLMNLFGAHIDRTHRGSDIDEIRGAIDLYQGPGAETNERRHMLKSILDLADLTVEDVMIHRRNVNSVNFGQPTEDAVAHIMEHTHTRIPMWSGTPENIIGIIHVKQVLFALYDVKGEASAVDLLSLMTRPWFIPNTTRLLDQLRAFRHRREQLAVVVDEYGTFMGVVTLEDILEEIVGDIHDEEDLISPGIRKMPDGSVLVNGDITIRELNRQLGWHLPDDQDYTTIAGLVIYESRSVPNVGQSFAFHGLQFDIVKRQRNQISAVKIIPLDTIKVA